jgi:hypothetical protein
LEDFGIQDLVKSFQAVLTQPGESFSALFPKDVPLLISSLLLFLAIAGLLYQPPYLMAALVGMTAFGIFFRVIHLAAYRVAGLFLIFLIFLYWTSIETAHGKVISWLKQFLFNTGLYVAILGLIVVNIINGKTLILDDINLERSSSKAFGEFLSTSQTYHDAIIVPEPDYLIESLPYYAPNKIYLPREQRFGTTVTWTTDANYYLTLDELLSTAHDLKILYDQPVLIVIGHMDFDSKQSGEKEYSYNKVFAWNQEQLAYFDETTMLVAVFDTAYTDENYRVFEIR